MATNKIDWNAVNIKTGKNVTSKIINRLYTQPQLKELCSKISSENEYQSLCGPRGGFRKDFALEWLENNWKKLYPKIKTATREMFFNSDKLKEQQSGCANYDLELAHYQDTTKHLYPRKLMGNQIDDMVNQYTRNHQGLIDKDETNAHYSDIIYDMNVNKRLTTTRNDLCELLLIHNNLEIMPTLKHISGVDYFIDGIAYDQKVSISTGAYQVPNDIKEIDKYDLAKTLLENQTAGRFNNFNRVFVVFVDKACDEINEQNIVFHLMNAKITNNTDIVKYKFNNTNYSCKVKTLLVY